MNIETLKTSLRPLYVPISNWHYNTFKAPKRYSNLYKTIIDIKAKSILEVGTWNGKRAVEMIETAAQFHPVSDISYYGFDLFEEIDNQRYESEISKKPPSKAVVLSSLEKTGANIYLYQGDTSDTMSEAVKNIPKIDFIYIDGGHSYETIENDWKYSKILMHDKTVVIFDDYWLNREDGGCKKLVDALDREEYDVALSDELDIFDNKDFGKLEIRYAIVTKK
jgi:hypothetical protein